MNRICPSCKNKIEYKSYKVFWKAKKHNSTCRPCFYKSLIGHTHSELTKRKIGESNKISLIGNIPPNKGVKMSKKQKILLSQTHKGIKHSEDTKRKHRINMLKRLEKYNIPPNEDIGAREFFCDWNKNHHSDFKPKRFFDIGYDADGYDEILHSWIEFDPPHHYYVDGSLKDKDIIRQNNIIEHFKNIDKPLNGFIRVKSDKSKKIIEINNVYQGGL